MLRPNYTLIYKVRVGSHAYGMNTPTSDEDFAGIFIPNEEYFFGLQSFDQQIEQTEEKDTTLYSLRKYTTLAVANNPNVLELLFVDKSDILYCHPVMFELRAIRRSFLSQKCAKTYLGYAQAQLHRIRSHQKWIGQEVEAMKILEPAAVEGLITREWVAWRFGENMVTRLEQIGSLSYDWESDKRSEMDRFLEPLKELGIVCPNEEDPKFWQDHKSGKGHVYMKHLYDAAKKQRDQYVTWMAERNPARHEMELKFGYDTKHAAHLVRLLRTGYEILTEGDCLVRRPDAAELLSIRQGAWSYDKICAYADEMIAKVQNLTKFAVPECPNYDTINDIIIDMTKEVLMSPSSFICRDCNKEHKTPGICPVRDDVGYF